MYLPTILPSLAALTLAHPTRTTTNNNLIHRAPIPDSAFITPISAKSTPSPTPSRRPHGHAVVNNHCNFPIYLWSVGTTARQERTLLPNDVYSELFREEKNTGGIAIKISTDVDGLYTSAPQMVFAYNLSNLTQGKVWYDLSDVFGDPFEGYPVSLSPAEPRISWPDGVPSAGSQVRVTSADTDLVLSLC
ncbi:hypothetical protein N7522_011516 [Penicillium canescens]|uniref:Blastomyces yeast-phase-specific protein n=1 Tax=Penicillium canescens TaxID=5083 RepID=A0AAD6ILR9_PENCN|nr:uncharacterized protein N7446_007237 [Penicillium canescens]KAJ5991309.1 hypothetical protein N7522_011516 [Penicillium canescens]KAJ6049432.1 hypothetical protein N7444_006148 [Penicillium canescens]KAJ6052598.1 hypothetical protein N7460_003132 [Penicillium canescens]KAJ6063117.1 hypothetical protein N7446_007237 [Penicillium canescens]